MILCCPDKLRGSLAAREAAAALARGVEEAGLQARALPLADGGEGTLDALIDAAEAEVFEVAAPDALGAPATARVAMLDGGRAVIEMAEAAGHRPQGPRDVMRASTEGVGRVIRAAFDLGARHVTVGAGGTTTVDGGLGALRALGGRLIAADGSELAGGGEGLTRLAEIDAAGLDPRLRGALRIAVDVTAPLCGPDGAARAFGPQKGADPGEVEELEAGLGRLAALVGADPVAASGLGAAGGFAAPFVALAAAEVCSGAAFVRDAVGLRDAMAGARLCVTAEGKVDRQTAMGKTIAGVVETAAAAGVPAVVVAGTVDPEGADALYELGAAAVLGVLSGPMTPAEAEDAAAAELQRAGRGVASLAARLGV